MWQFSDGLVITAARAPYEDLVGSRIEAIDGRPIAEVLALVEPLAPRDNPSNLLAYAPLYLRTSELLAGLGVLEARRAGHVHRRRAGGRRADPRRRIEPILADDDVAWHGGDPLTLPPTGDAALAEPQDRTRCGGPTWPTRETLYVQYNEVRGGIDAIADEILARAKQADVDRVVVDLRNNGGGDNTTYRHLLAVLQDPAIDRPGGSTLLIGRLTFSAAANFATELEQTTGATFVGEAMGGSPNLYGDVRPTRPAVRRAGPIDVYVATRYWEKSTADDPRITIEPDLAVPFSSADYLAGRSGSTRHRRGVAGGEARYPAPVTDTPDLLITGGTVVTRRRVAAGRRRGPRRADRGGRAGPRRPRGRTRARRSTRPGSSSCRARSTSTRTRGSRPTREPDRFFQDSVAAAFGGTTTFLSFNNPGTGSSPAAERSLRTGRARVARGDRRRQRDRLSG